MRGADRSEPLFRRLAGRKHPKGVLSRQQFVDTAARRENIAPRPRGSASEALRAGMKQAHARHSGDAFDFLKRQSPGNARKQCRPGNIEIEQHDPTRPGQEDVGWFDIAMRNAEAVKMRQDFEYFRSHGHCPPAEPFRATSEGRVCRDAFQKLHAKADAPRFPMQVIGAHDAGMRDMPQGEKLTGKGQPRLAKFSRFGQQALQRHLRPWIAALHP